MPTNIADKIYLGDILLCAGAGAGECGACVGAEATFLTFDNSSIDFNFSTFDTTSTIGDNNINFEISSAGNFISFDTNDIDYNIKTDINTTFDHNDVSFDINTYDATINYYPSTALLLNFNGENGATSTTDESANNLSVIFGANTQISTSQSKFGGSSLYVNGGNIRIDSTSAINLDASEPFTIEMWVYSTQHGSTWSTILSRRTASSWQYQIAAGFGSNRYYYFGNNNITGISTDGVGPYLALNTWTHLAAVVYSNNIARLFVNGTQVGSPVSWPIYSDHSAPLIIGSHINNGTEYFYGYIDNLRIVRGAALYTSNFTPSNTAVGLYP